MLAVEREPICRGRTLLFVSYQAVLPEVELFLTGPAETVTFRYANEDVEQ